MRSSLSFSLDSTADAKLIQWLSEQPNRSATVRDGLYLLMAGGMQEVNSVTPLLAATRRIEAELNELKELILKGTSPAITDLLGDRLTAFKYGKDLTVPDSLSSDIPPTDVPIGDVLSNLRKLKK